MHTDAAAQLVKEWQTDFPATLSDVAVGELIRRVSTHSVDMFQLGRKHCEIEMEAAGFRLP